MGGISAKCSDKRTKEQVTEIKLLKDKVVLQLFLWNLIPSVFCQPSPYIDNIHIWPI